ncbi:MAG TPA: hypothetical protein VMZ00_12555 [Sporichthya sp.]|nr:hypothetical protein [Sporichthya sp.]
MEPPLLAVAVEPSRARHRLPVPPPLPIPASMREAVAAPPVAEPTPVPAPAVERRPTPMPAPVPRRVAVVKPAPAAAAKSPSVATLERPAPQQIASVVLEEAPLQPEDDLDRPGLATRVASLPRVLLDTVAWGGFAAVVALIVIALSDVGMGRAALWATGLSGIVVLAVAVMAVTGTHLEELNSATKLPEGSD